MEDKLRKMEKKSSDLSDIVLEKSSRSAEGTKKWLLTIASAILLFLIILIVMKMFKQSDVTPDKDNIANVGESVESINSDEEVKSQGENLFKKEPIIDEASETDEKFEEMVKKLKEQDVLIEAPKVQAPEVKPVEVAKEIVKEVKPKELQTITQEPVAVITTPVKAPPVVKAPPSVKKIVQPVKKVVKPKKDVKKVSQVFSQTKIPSISGYFIQVGATAKSFPDKRFLKKIKGAGFDYIVHGVNVKGKKIKKVLVGPYSSKSGALNALPAVKANINPGAYIYRLK